jgi:hypothetical protein
MLYHRGEAMRLRVLAASVIVLTCCIAASAGAAELVVVSDTAAIGYSRGAVLADGAHVAIPAGERLALIDASGRGLTLRGPYDGPVNAPVGALQGPAVLPAIKAILDPAVNISLGAARAIGDGPQPPDPKLIDVSDNATVCVESGAAARLWRAPPTRRATLFLTRLSTGDRAEIDWPANEPTVAWPASIQLADGESYQIALAGALSKPRLLVRIIPSGASSVATATRLADAGCRNQAVNMLESIAAANAQ